MTSNTTSPTRTLHRTRAPLTSLSSATTLPLRPFLAHQRSTAPLPQCLTLNKMCLIASTRLLPYPSRSPRLPFLTPLQNPGPSLATSPLPSLTLSPSPSSSSTTSPTCCLRSDPEPHVGVLAGLAEEQAAEGRTAVGGAGSARSMRTARLTPAGRRACRPVPGGGRAAQGGLSPGPTAGRAEVRLKPRPPGLRANPKPRPRGWAGPLASEQGRSAEERPSL